MSRVIAGLEVDIYSVDFVNTLQDKLDRLESVNAQLVEACEAVTKQIDRWDEVLQYARRCPLCDFRMPEHGGGCPYVAVKAALAAAEEER